VTQQHGKTDTLLQGRLYPTLFGKERNGMFQTTGQTGEVVK
jgi:hypothetical protein